MKRDVRDVMFVVRENLPLLEKTVKKILEEIDT
jgi:hypothetical protein